MSSLVQRLAECHIPVSKPYSGAAVPGILLVQCAACDGSGWTIWAPGDEPYSCELWREAVADGLVGA